jgi:hypothetical protein
LIEITAMINNSGLDAVPSFNSTHPNNHNFITYFTLNKFFLYFYYFLSSSRETVLAISKSRALPQQTKNLISILNNLHCKLHSLEPKPRIMQRQLHFNTAFANSCICILWLRLFTGAVLQLVMQKVSFIRISQFNHFAPVIFAPAISINR